MFQFLKKAKAKSTALVPIEVMPLERYLNWPVRLNKYIITERDKPFEYGVNDCCTFVAGAVRAITGQDLMVEFRGHYHDDATADQALLERGRGKLYRTIRAKLGKSVPGVYGHKGDVAFHNGSCGIVLGRYAIFTGSEGYVFVPIMMLQRAFHVGCGERGPARSNLPRVLRQAQAQAQAQSEGK